MTGKDATLSLTILGMVVAVAAQVLQVHGITIDQAGWTNDLVTAVGALISIIGRVKAMRPITSVAGLPVKGATPTPPTGPTSSVVAAALVPQLLIGVMIAALGLAVSGCANDAQRTAGQATQIQLIQACDGYSVALASLADLRAAGRLDQAAVQRVDQVRALVTPICTAPEPAGDVATLLAQVGGGTAQLTGLIAAARAPPAATSTGDQGGVL